MDCPFFLVVCRLKGFTRDLRGTQAAPSKKNSADSFLYLLYTCSVRVPESWTETAWAKGVTEGTLEVEPPPMIMKIHSLGLCTARDVNFATLQRSHDNHSRPYDLVKCSQVDPFNRPKTSIDAIFTKIVYRPALGFLNHRKSPHRQPLRLKSSLQLFKPHRRPKPPFLFMFCNCYIPKLLGETLQRFVFHLAPQCRFNKLSPVHELVNTTSGWFEVIWKYARLFLIACQRKACPQLAKKCHVFPAYLSCHQKNSFIAHDLLDALRKWRMKSLLLCRQVICPTCFMTAHRSTLQNKLQGLHHHRRHWVACIKRVYQLLSLCHKVMRLSVNTKLATGLVWKRVLMWKSWRSMPSKKAWGNDDGMCHPTMGLLQHGMCHDKIKWRIPKLTMKTKRIALIYKFKIYDMFGL